MGGLTEHELQTSSAKSRLLDLFKKAKTEELVVSRLGTVKSHGGPQEYLSETVEMYAETRVNSAVLSISVSRSGVLVGCDDGNIFLMTADLAVVRTFQGAHRGACNFIEWHPDGIHFLSSGSDRTVRVWSLNNGIGNLLSIPHSCEVTAACFDPRCVAISDQQVTSIWLFTCGLDNRLRFWKGSLLEQYESLGPAVVPLHLTASEAEIDQTAIFVGTRDGRVLQYNFAQNSFVFAAEIFVRNRHGKFSSGAAVSGIRLGAGGEILVSTKDHRLRVLARPTLEAVGKFKGLVNGPGDFPGGFGGFFSAAPGSKGVFLVSGSECGNVFVWPRGSSDKERTSERWECFLASEKPDRLTAVSPAPWNPETSEILPLCVVVGTKLGVVRVFYNRTRLQNKSSPPLNPVVGADTKNTSRI